MKYRVRFIGRRSGAIGIFYEIQLSLEAVEGAKRDDIIAALGKAGWEFGCGEIAGAGFGSGLFGQTERLEFQEEAA